MDAITDAGYCGKIVIGMDVAASEMYENKKYNLAFKDSKPNPSMILNSDKLSDLYMSIINKYPIKSIEDPFEQDDWEPWIVGDDLTVTNIDRVRKAIDAGACNCLLLKVNQIGSFTEALAAAQLARRNGWNVMVSHRSGETEDCTIADIVVGLNVGQVKQN
ncbi:unnamed protein product [Dibothriocephalus latus]|uniref:phosphopyruvate hydratase n=1 Tax=Dibothriocephalus latus TaxID=60516 RepID=A0A3P7Q802_DIBLA|nr:unnamed protein product [Dibothriocephalus latus]